MELLRSEFVLPYKIRRSQMSATSRLAPRRFCLQVLSVFRENFPVYSRWRSHEIHCENSHIIRHSAVSRDNSSNSKQPELSFDRLQLSEKEYLGLEKRKFGHFIAREAVLDEEYWTAAWLRAEAHWESVSYMRHIDSYKRKYAEQEFYSLKRRCFGQDGNSVKCLCFVAVKKEENDIRRTVLNSVVGTLDFSIRRYIHGETYPGELKGQPLALANQELLVATRYAYISNVCVSKFARRQGIASNMLFLAINVAASSVGMKELFVHVNSDNKPARELYKKIGFKIVEKASSPLSKDQRILMSMEL